MTLPRLFPSARYGGLEDERRVAFARIEPGKADARDLAEEIATRCNTWPELARRCTDLERELKEARGERILAEAKIEELRVALDAQTILKTIAEPRR
ncbi:MAG: hypothetical protein ACE37J_14035 [Pikeienuella sp.]|uniref:hypothetical protein n=1 Tax=Pikeienuella sp. TaxID=2831957 RepID=UPI00391D31BA